MAKFISNIKYPYENSWDKTNTNVTFEIEKVNLSFVNALRRECITNVSTFGFRTEPYEKNNVEIITNDTSLNNQIICHRIGMIPLNITDDDFNIEDYEFILDAKNDTNFPKWIKSNDFKIKQISTDTFLDKKEVEKIFPKDAITGDYIIISKLKPCYNIINYKLNSYKDELINKQGKVYQLHLKAKAVLSNGAENSRFSPTTTIAHSFKVDDSAAEVAKKHYIKQEINDMKAKGLKLKTEKELGTFFDTTHKERYFLKNEEGEPIHFIFSIESIGVIPPLIIFYRSIKCLINRLEKFIINLKSKNDNVIIIEPSPNLADGYKLIVHNENDTLGNLLSEYMYEKYCVGEEPDINIIGYKKIHPLDEKIFFNLNSNKYKSWEELNSLFVEASQDIIKTLKKLQSELENIKDFIKELKSL